MILKWFKLVKNGIKRVLKMITLSKKIAQNMADNAKTMLKLKFPINPILSLMGPESAIPKQQ